MTTASKSQIQTTDHLKCILAVCFKEMIETFPFELLDHKAMVKDEQRRFNPNHYLQKKEL